MYVCLVYILCSTIYSSVVLGKLLLQYTFYTYSREKMPCNDGKEKGEFLLRSKLISKCGMQLEERES